MPLSYLQGHQDGLEWAAQLAKANHPETGDWLYDDPIELTKAIRQGPDLSPVEPGNYPVIPDGSSSGIFNSARALLDVMYEFGPYEIAISEHVTNLEDALRNAAAPQQEAE